MKCQCRRKEFQKYLYKTRHACCKCNQMTFQSQQQELNQENVREFINKYEKMLVQQEQQQQTNLNSGQTLLINRDSKQQFGTSTIEDMFKLSQSQQDSQQQNQFSYDTSNFGNDQIGKRRQEENLFNNLQNYSKDYEQECSLQSSKCFKDYMMLQEKTDTNLNQNKQQQKKSFEQFYQEHVEEEINNIQIEIEEMQRFLQRVQTAKDKLTNSFKDLQQIPVINRQSSEKSIQKVTEDLKLIDIIKQNMIKQMENNVDQDKLKKLRNMKHQIQLYFNNVEDELLMKHIFFKQAQLFQLFFLNNLPLLVKFQFIMSSLIKYQIFNQINYLLLQLYHIHIYINCYILLYQKQMKKPQLFNDNFFFILNLLSKLYF